MDRVFCLQVECVNEKLNSISSFTYGGPEFSPVVAMQFTRWWPYSLVMGGRLAQVAATCVYPSGGTSWPCNGHVLQPCVAVGYGHAGPCVMRAFVWLFVLALCGCVIRPCMTIS